MSFQENLGKRNCEIEGETERRKGRVAVRDGKRDREGMRGRKGERERDEKRGGKRAQRISTCRETSGENVGCTVLYFLSHLKYVVTAIAWYTCAMADLELISRSEKTRAYHYGAKLAAAPQIRGESAETREVGRELSDIVAQYCLCLSKRLL